MVAGPFVDRDSQLAALVSYAEEARAGEGRIVLVSGEAGIGKSTLLESLVPRLPAATFWWGGCDGLSTPRPLAPLVDIAEQAGGELLERCETGVARDDLFAALMRALQLQQQLLVMIVEDVHWADEATLDLIRFVARRIRTLPVLVAITYRSDALGPTDPLRAALGDLATHRNARRIALGALSRDAVVALAQDSPLDPDALYALTGGNPFFVTELLSAGTLEIPGSARDLVLARAAGLTSAARDVLDHAALIGSVVGPAVLAAATRATSASLDDLLRSGLLVADRSMLRFRHEITRRTLAAEVPPHGLARCHAAILDALESVGGDDAQLAYHAEAAGDADRVLEYAPRAARTAATLASHREAAAQFERAVRSADAADAHTKASLLDELADQLAFVERWDDAARARSQAILLWRQLGDTLREGAAETRLSTVMWRLCRGPESVAARRRAKALLEPHGPTAELAALYAMGADSDDPEAIEHYVTEAARIAAELDLTQLRVHALNGIGCLAAGRMEDFETPLREALVTAMAHGLQVHAALSYANLTEYLVDAHRFADAEPLFAEALPYCDEHDVATYGNCVRGHRALGLLDECRWDEALGYAREVLGAGASPINRLSSLITAGLVAARRGDPAAAGRYLADAEAAAVGVDESEYLADARLALAEAAWLAGDDDAARRQLESLRPYLTPLGARATSAVIAWASRLGVSTDSVPAEKPYALQVAGDCRAAAAEWDALDMPYHAALALGDSDDESDLRDAVRRLDQLSPAAARRIRARMRSRGLRTVPAGARAGTRSDPNGLTPREREVLTLLGANLTNEQIAARLVISAKTVDHHVSAVLAKLGVASRREAGALHAAP